MYRLVLVFLFLCSLAPVGLGEVLYQSSYETSGEIPQVLNGNPAISDTVVNSGKSLEFEGRLSSEQVRIPINTDSSKMYIRFYAKAENLRDSDYSFKMLMDTPQVRNTYIHGGLDAIQTFPGNLSTPFVDDRVYLIETFIDFDANTWETKVDGQSLGVSPIDATELRSVRFAISPWTANATSDALDTKVFLDDVLITTGEDVPPPPTGVVLFSSPFEVGSDIPSVTFGNPELSDTLVHSGKSLEFEGRLSYEQVRIPINTDSSTVYIRFYALTQNLRNSDFAFAMHVDSPQVRTTDFHGGSNKILTFPGTANTDFVDDKVYLVETLIDIDANTWETKIDGQSIGVNAFDASEVRSVRFSMSPWTGAANSDALDTKVFIDELLISTASESGGGGGGGGGGTGGGNPTTLPYTSSFETGADIPAITFGNPELSDTVVHSGKSLEFEGRLSYEQVKIPIDTDSSTLYIRFYALAQNLQDSDYAFTMYVDSPEVRNTYFHGGSNQIQTFPGTASATFVDDKVYLVESLIDINANTWETKIDGQSIGVNAFNASEFKSIRFGMAPWTGAAGGNSLDTKVFIDELLISTTSDNGGGGTGGGGTGGGGSATLPYSSSFESNAEIPTVTAGNPELSTTLVGSGKSLEFEGRLSYEQVEIPIDSDSPTIYIRYSALTQNLRDSDYTFKMAMDTPQVRNTHFHGGTNLIRTFPNTRSTSFSDGQVYVVETYVDFVANTWETRINGQSIGISPIDASGIDSIRFTMSPWTANASSDALDTKVFIDDLLIDVAPGDLSGWGNGTGGGGGGGGTGGGGTGGSAPFTLPYESPFEEEADIPTITFGNPELSDTLVHSGKSLEFEGRLSYEQIKIPLDTDSETLYIRFYAKTQNLRDSDYSFTMAMDTPQVRNTSFHGGLNMIRTFPNTATRSFEDNTVYLIETYVNFSTNRWETKVDGQTIGISSINADGIDSLRFTMSPWTGAASGDALDTKVFIDDLLIAENDGSSTGGGGGGGGSGGGGGPSGSFDLPYTSPFESSGDIPNITAGNPQLSNTVVNSGKSLEFEGRLSYEQIQIPVSIGDASSLYIRYYAKTQNLRNSDFAFTMAMDTPEVRNTSFHGGNNNIYTFPNPRSTPFADGTVYLVETYVDFAANTWNTKINGQSIGTSPINATSIDSIRFTMAPWTGAATSDALDTKVFIDDLYIAETDGTSGGGGGGGTGGGGVPMELLYSSSFETPGDIPTIVMGAPELSDTVVNSGKSLEFEGRLSYEQIRIPISTDSRTLYIRYHARTENLRDSDYSFSMIMDTPQVRTTSFHGGLNTLRTFPTGKSTPFSDDRTYLVETLVDFDTNQWTTKVDGQSIGVGPLNGTAVSAVRFNMSPWTGAATSDALNTKVFIDDLVIATSDQFTPATIQFTGPLGTPSFLRGQPGSGTIHVPISVSRMGELDLNVAGEGFSSSVRVFATPSDTSVSIPVNYDGTGLAVNRLVTISSPSANSTKSGVISVSDPGIGSGVALPPSEEEEETARAEVELVQRSASRYFGLAIQAGGQIVKGNVSAIVSYNSQTGEAPASLFLTYEGIPYRLRSILDSEGALRATFTKRDTESSEMSLTLQLQESGGSYLLEGELTGDGQISQIELYQHDFHPQNNPFTEAGGYSMILPSEKTADSRVLPGGDGIARVTATTSGRFRSVGHLGDGTPFTLAGFVSPTGEVAVFTQLYPGRNTGHIGGILKFGSIANIGAGHGSLHWKKVASSLDGPYPDGFDIPQPALLSAYTAPNFRAGEFLISEMAEGPGNAKMFLGDDGDGSTRLLTWTTQNRVSLAGHGDELLFMRASFGTGLVHGRLFDKNTKENLRFKGIVFPEQDLIVGYYLDGDRTCYFEMSATGSPELELTDQNGTTIPNGTTLNFADTGAEGGFSELVIFAANVGDGQLHLRDAPELDSTEPESFAVTGYAEGFLSPGNQQAIRIRFEPQSLGVKSATLQIFSNDETASPFEINLSGTAVPSADGTGFITGTLASSIQTAGQPLSIAGSTPSDYSRDANGLFFGLVQKREAGSPVVGTAVFKLSNGPDDRLGALSGSISIEGIRLPIRGQVFSTGVFSGDVAGVRSADWTPTMQLSITENGGLQLVAEVEEESTGEIYDIVAIANPYHGRLNPAPASGRYTAVIPASEEVSSLVPGGHGFSSFVLAPSGRARILVSLPDRSRVGITGFLSADQQMNLYTPNLHGTLSFRDLPGISDLDGKLTWTVPTNARASSYPRGFVRIVDFIGSQFVAPPPGTPVLSSLEATGGAARLNLTSVSVSESLDVEWNELNQVTFQPTANERLVVRINSRTGLVNGFWWDRPANAPRRPLAGAILQKQQGAFGLFLDGNQVGALDIGPIETD